ncbi:hypothetical protein FC07_GL000390 [Loigolactobacillus bifermentans DSM 20003]|uniref:Addiction module toxin RelE n=1 Tax=Loigolactobacillus bifermentans DSM 20003 TaxID=1423726 RepID=A0A0R1GKN6_9LACO|nr:hypothetical protein FC07_GL000390 [Loigolactobacillus bifermentans DSM 20003]
MNDLLSAFDLLIKTGQVTEAYTPHLLNNKGGNYNNLLEFHLSDGKVDVLVIYKTHHTNPVIRFVRIGPHSQLFQGKYH